MISARILTVLTLALISAIVTGQDKSPFSVVKPKPESEEKVDPKGAFGQSMGKPKPHSNEGAQPLDGLGPAIDKTDSREKAATLNKLYDIYGGNRGISFVSFKSAAGDTASGVVVERSNNQITLDTTPCVDQKRLVTFVAPYKESKIDAQRCGDKSFPRSQVIQVVR